MQPDFAAALLNPSAPLPAGLIDPMGRPAPRRFDVYRNNVTLGLIRVLQAGFPATRTLVGEDFFAAMAREFLRAHPPKTRMMMLYGDEFAGFIAGFAPAAALGYLPDVARLEQAIRQSYHAGDAAPMDAAVFAGMNEGRLMALRFPLRLPCSCCNRIGRFTAFGPPICRAGLRPRWGPRRFWCCVQPLTRSRIFCRRAAVPSWRR